MIKHILVPLDGSALAECVIPHVRAVASAFEARVTLMHVVETRVAGKDGGVIDLLDWNLKKLQSRVYMESIMDELSGSGLKIDLEIQEGAPAERIIEFSRKDDIDLILLSTHGQGGLNGWNISSIVQKIIMRSHKSFLLVRAYRASEGDPQEVHYNRLFVGLDASTRAEFAIPVAVKLAQAHHATLVLGTMIGKPELLHQFPLTDEEQKLAEQVIEHNRGVVTRYLDQLSRQISQQGVETETSMGVSSTITKDLHLLAEEKKADMVILSAHGQASVDRWPYGSVANSFIVYGNTTLLVLQDFSPEEIRDNPAESATHQTQGH